MMFLTIISFVILIEAMAEAVLWSMTDPATGKTGWSKERIIPLLVSVIMCVAFQIDVFAVSGFSPPFPWLVPIIGPFATGIVASRGSNYIHDLTNLVTGIKNKLPTVVK